METPFATSDTTDKLDAALSKAQGEIVAASKDKTNPHFKSKYADLASVWEACRGALTKNGINVTQWLLHSEDGRLHIVTRLACGGQWLRGHFSIPVSKPDAQGYGSATTYAKRFALAAAVGVVADDDDDGNAASARPTNGSHQERRQNSNGNGHTPQPPKNTPAMSPDPFNKKGADEMWVDQQIAKLKEAKSKQGVTDWWKANTKAINKLEATNPTLHQSFMDVIDDVRNSLPDITRAA